MKCHKCAATAAFNMRRHKLALCEEHYLSWFVEQTERAIQKYDMFSPDDRILVAVSGGKDSLALWDVLLRLGYRADGLYIDLGIDGQIGYSTTSKEYARAFAAQHPQATLHVVDVRERYGESIPELTRRKHRSRRRCSICGLVKRHEMNRVSIEGAYGVLATGHNLDDEAAALFGNVMRWRTPYLSRQHPTLPARSGGLARKVKPLCRFYERDVAAYAILQGIDYIYEECPFSVGASSLAFKETLSRMENHSAGTKMHFYLSFLDAKEAGHAAFATDDESAAMHPCARCGQPTTAPDICAFCRLWEGGDEEGP